MADPPSVAVSVINYNSEENLRKLLKKIFAQSYKVDIWLVDNDSPDKGGKRLKKGFPKINLIESKENDGFAKGHNLALRKIKTDYTLIINPDVEVPEGAIGEMANFMEKHPSCGVSSCRIVDYDNKLQSNGGDLPFGGPLLVWSFNLEMFPAVEKLLGNFHRTQKEYYKQTRVVGWVGGTFMFIRNEILEKTGYLPEKYFMYFEDVHFCYRVQKEGFKVMLNPEVTIRHQGGASSKDPRLAQFKGEWVGLEKFYHQQIGILGLLLIKLLAYVSIFVRVIAFGLIGKLNISKVYWKVLSYV